MARHQPFKTIILYNTILSVTVVFFVYAVSFNVVKQTALVVIMILVIDDTFIYHVIHFQYNANAVGSDLHQLLREMKSVLQVPNTMSQYLPTPHSAMTTETNRFSFY